MGAPCNNSLPQESRCQSLLLKLPFQDAPKAREDPASEAAGAKDAEGGGAGGGGGERGPVTWCSGAPKCAHPADVTVREFGTQFSEAIQCGVLWLIHAPRWPARGAPRATGWDHTSSPGTRRGWRGAGGGREPRPRMGPRAAGTDSLHRGRDRSRRLAPQPRGPSPTRLTRRHELPGPTPRASARQTHTHSAGKGTYMCPVPFLPLTSPRWREMT